LRQEYSSRPPNDWYASDRPSGDHGIGVRPRRLDDVARELRGDVEDVDVRAGLPDESGLPAAAERDAPAVGRPRELADGEIIAPGKAGAPPG
jgi:hypothetical protein